MEENVRLAFKISLKSILINIFLFGFKLVCGLLIHSYSLISDAVHSLSDVFSTGIVMLGIKISRNPADESHPYGHEKIEVLIALGLGLLLFYIGGSIGYEGIKKIISPEAVYAGNIYLNIAGMAAALTSIALKEWLYRFTIQCARTIDSQAMAADAWHHRSDALSSLGSLAGVIGITFGMPLIDSIACLAVSVFIFKAAYEIIMDSFNTLVDHACSNEIIEAIEKQIYAQEEIVSLDALKTRMFGPKIYLDVEITVDKDLSLQKAHSIAASIHDAIETNVGGVKHCMVHVNPTGLIAHHHI